MKAEKVSKAEDGQLRDYELVLIINPEIGDEAVDAQINNLSQSITGKGGSISEIERWGKRKLAYPIRHFMEGDYVLARFRLKPVLCKELEANLRLSEEVLRHLLINLS